MNANRQCSICDNRQVERIYKRTFERVSDGLVGGYDVVACRCCGFCFADNVPSQTELDIYYEKQSKYEHDHRNGQQSEFDMRRRPFTVGMISAWLPDRSSKILDVGCASGDLLTELKKQGYKEVRGVDPSPSCAKMAKELYDIDVVTAPISRVSCDLGQFDLVILAAVLEHIRDLDATLINVRGLLNPGGCVLVEVPDMTRCSLINDAAFQEFSVEHINYFSPVSLQNLWSKHGFQTVGIQQTEIEQVPGLTLYEIRAMFRYTDSQTTESLQPDVQTRAELHRYVTKSQAKLSQVQQLVNTLVDGKRPVVVWGVGTYTQGLLATTRLGKANIRAFVDSNANYQGQRLNGVPILTPTDLHAYPEPIVISSSAFQEEIASQIRDVLHLNNEIIRLFDATAPATALDRSESGR